MSKLSDFMLASNTTAGDMLRDAAEQRFAQFLTDLQQKIPAAGQRLERDLKALMRPFVPNATVADYLGFMLMVALVQDTGVNMMAPAVNKMLPDTNLGQRTRRAQRERASSPRKVEKAVEKAILRGYRSRVAAGETYGAIKALAAQYGVHRDTISAIVKPRAGKRKAD